MRVLVVSKSELFREMLLSCLQGSAITIAADHSGARSILDLQHEDIVLLHAGTDSSEAIAELEYLAAANAAIRILVLTNDTFADLPWGTLNPGVMAVIPESLSVDVLIAALTLVAAGFRFARPTARHSLYGPEAAAMPVSLGQPAVLLSRRETDIMLKLRDGLANKDIGGSLGINETTVKVHLRNCFRKIGVSNRTQAAIWGMSNLQLSGLADPLPSSDAPAFLGQMPTVQTGLEEILSESRSSPEAY